MLETCLNGGDLSLIGSLGNSVTVHAPVVFVDFRVSFVSVKEVSLVYEREKMAEAHQTRVQNVVEEMVQSLEKEHIRKMQVGVLISMQIRCIQQDLCISCLINGVHVIPLQGRMFKCSADCCDRPTDSMSQVHQCIERCHTPLAQAQSLVTSELEKFQVIFMWCHLSLIQFGGDKGMD